MAEFNRKRINNLIEKLLDEEDSEALHHLGFDSDFIEKTFALRRALRKAEKIKVSKDEFGRIQVNTHLDPNTPIRIHNEKDHIKVEILIAEKGKD